MAPLAGERDETPVVEDEEPDLGEPLDHHGVRAVSARHGEFVKEPRDPVVAGRESEAAGLVSERLDEIGFAGARRAGEQDGLAIADPLGADHRIFDSSHDLFGAWKTVAEAMPDEGWLQRAEGYVSAL